MDKKMIILTILCNIAMLIVSIILDEIFYVISYILLIIFGFYCLEKSDNSD